MSSPNKPCFHCYHVGHAPSERCPNDGLIACTKCFRLYVFSKGCNCMDRQLPDPPQVLRLVGKKKAPRWFTDLCIHDRFFPALLNTTISRCKISTELKNWWQSVTTTTANSSFTSIDIKRKGRIIRVACDVVDDLGDNIHIHLGTELMTFLGYTFTMENITIKSNHSPVLSGPYETEYVYNLPSVGEDLRNYLLKKRHFLKKGKPVNKSYGDLKLEAQSRIVKIRRSSSSSESSTRAVKVRRISTTSSDSRC